MPATKRKLIIVSNRLPISIKRVNGSFQSSVSSGGLVTALSGLTKTTSFRWFGWPGIEASDPEDQKKIQESLMEHNAVPIFLDKSCGIGFSLHTPFPVWDFWRGLPVGDDLVKGILASDLIGFHTEEYRDNFAGCTRSLGANIQAPNQIHYKDRQIIADTFIVGIDPKRFTDMLQNKDVQKRISELEENYKGVTLILGVDRMDYIKGLPEKLKGYDYFLDQHPELRNKVVLIQIAVPSREDVKEYQELEHEVSMIAGRINGKHATPDGTPLIYMHRSISFPELTALYCVADVCLLTSTRDGMNLVSFEYIACQAERHGVLALSEFAGAASFMKQGSITFHPVNITQIAEAIEKAINMSKEDRKRRYEGLREFIVTYTRYSIINH
ncbi:hypothetical protein FE257_012403 [Aspergillus nanangensis]|uniref:alpha,alpha-trehalose-phosphate synthase (UDP-forming) n=1 Tax=Aspergillus nanangensis TaxID=2582783 RepID=A0AAD4GXI1_ASPNN|nr:hypothetical protein FE257_012403 [Aspergillus nanangensis]